MTVLDAWRRIAEFAFSDRLYSSGAFYQYARRKQTRCKNGDATLRHLDLLRLLMICQKRCARAHGQRSVVVRTRRIEVDPVTI
jgi:hypothetical protein